MKNIIKVRSFDSIKKLNYKRAKGKLKNIDKLNNQIYSTILSLERIGLLTTDLLWDLTERRKLLYIEGRKLDYLIKCRETSLPLQENVMNDYISKSVYVSFALMRVPYEIRVINDYLNYIHKREKDENNIFR